ncbi:MAG: Gfo/Idh/MocA family oxidoreductase [Rhodothermales bacterium]|nr:Gfo/Idh/MocA family oxidoreductase [Rhodothermales bacterium]
MNAPIDRRTFVKTATAAGLGLGLTGPFRSIRGARSANSTVVVAVMGVNGRGGALANAFAQTTGSEVGFICDVDERAMAKSIADVRQRQTREPKGVKDFRSLLDGNDIDALVIAAPDHWHAPAALMAMQAGKHVYVEKPCGHNPREGELLIAAQKKYGKVVQMGTQQRSAPESIEIIQAIHEGLIGEARYAKCWYANTRGSIGKGKSMEVPSWLDFDLWQGPAPRRPYQDNLVHYNWHWFWNWGTGESLNNGTHEVDVCRWALGVDYPVRVASNGGRFHFNDDWEFYDTQVMSFDFAGGKTITWEGRSCNGLPFYDRGRGATIHGTEGTVLLDREGYIVYDLAGKEIKRQMRQESTDALNTVGADGLTDIHIQNFVDAVRDGKRLNTPIEMGHQSVLLCHLGNIAQYTGTTLECDPTNGHVKNDAIMKQMWGRTYEPGWEPTV